MKNKKLVFPAVIAMMVMGVSVFYACKKDLDSGRSVNSQSLKGLVTENVRMFPQYENYTPLESILEERLLMINNCVNNETLEMSDMELKEAVFFLEAYFNLGVCQWQKRSPKNMNMQETYSFTVPLIEGGTGAALILKGEVLKNAYVDMLQYIVTSIFPEYAVNYGDVFVQNINLANGSVTLAMDVCYGDPMNEGEEDEVEELEAIQTSYYPCLGTFRRSIVSDINDPGGNYVMLIYPGTFPNNPYKYAVYNFENSETKDVGMTLVINQKKTEMVPMGINVVNKQEEMIGNSCYSESVYRTTIIQFDLDFYNICGSGTGANAKTYGSAYRDHIWNNMCPTGKTPLEAVCNFKHRTDDATTQKGAVHHKLYLERTCSYFIPPCFIEGLHFDLVGF